MLLYSNRGKNLYNHCQNASLQEIGVHLFLKSIYLINHHSNIGIDKKYTIIKIIHMITDLNQ